MLRTIVHLDADAFFAAVEQAGDPNLRGRPVAVGGESRGIIASASYEARKFGVYTPMPTVRARKLCPKLIVLPGDYERYEQFSNWMFGYCYDFTPDVEQTSIDEGYFDLSSARKPAMEIAGVIRRAIGQKLKITVSEGIGSNKLVSAIASKLNKPSAFSLVPTGGETAFLHPLPNRWLPGIGPKTSTMLNTAGLARIEHLAATPLEMLQLLLGSQAPLIRQFARGIDERPLVPVREPQKTFSHQETFGVDVTDEEYAEAVLRNMADRLFARVREESRSVRTLTVRVRYNDMTEDQVAESLREPTDLETDVYGRIHLLLRQAWKRRVSLRLVSLKLSNVYDGRFRSELALDASARQAIAREKLARVIDELRHARGHEVILRAHDFRLRRPPTDPAAHLSPAAIPQGGITRLILSNHPPPPASSNRNSNPNRPNALPLLGERAGVRASLPPLNGRVPTIQPPHARSETGAPATKRLVQKMGTPFRMGTTSRPAKSVTDLQNYIPLRMRSHYSFLDSVLSPAAVVKLATKHNLPAIALTDLGNLHGAVEFTLEAQKAGIKPILGVELRVEKQPLLLYVESTTGYQNLCRLLSRHNTPLSGEVGHDDEGSVAARQRRSIPRELLHGFTDGLIAVSGDEDPRLAEMFPGRFYRLATTRETNSRFAMAACPSVRHATPEDRRKYDIVQSIRTLTLLREAHPEKERGGRFHFRAPEEMAAACQDHPGWLDCTREIADRCNFSLPFGKPQFPAYQPGDGSSPKDFLRHLALKGLYDRYPQAEAEACRPQLLEELNIIGAVGYEDYFLLTWDFLQECRRRDIEWITRGSAADSLVCYCLKISSVCPQRFKLYFRRFLNQDRMAMHKLPDIDIDFAHDRKDDVVNLLFEKYPDQCAVVGGFSTFQSRSAFAEVAKVLGMADRDVRKFTTRFPWSFGGWGSDDFKPAGGENLLDQLRANPENGDLPLDEEPFRTAVLMAEFLGGVPRYPKMHPCGVVLSRGPLNELAPTFLSQKGWATAHFDMDSVEPLGLVKMDILAQGGLAAMRDVKKTLQAQRGISVDTERCVARDAEGRLLHGDPGAKEPWGDARVWNMIAAGGARAVHHIESPAMIGLCRQSKVREIDGLVAIVSVIRPGAANQGKKLAFTRRYQNMEPVTYPHPCLEQCLGDTYGLVVYEEHILQLCEIFAGLSPGRSDALRRALTRQKPKDIEEIGKEFIHASLARGHAPDKIAEVWALASGFAGYAFCKAHSAAYGVEAYQSAWLKRYFPAEFMAAVLTNGKGFYPPIVYVLESHRLGLRFLPPSVNEPGPDFVPHGPAIRVPLVRAKGLTERTIQATLAAHKDGRFKSLADFFHRARPAAEEMEILIRAGGFDEFGDTRTEQFWQARHLLRVFGSQTVPGQGWLLPPPKLETHLAVPLQEPGRREKLEAEAELFSYAISEHPLELFPDIAWESYCPVNRLGDYIGQTITTCGLIVEQRTHHQVTGEPMKFLSLADKTGIIETELFAQTYKNYGLATVRYPVLELQATVEPFENNNGFSLRALRAGRPRMREGAKAP